MSHGSTEPGLSSLLKKLGTMTGVRATWRMEQSLLRTLGPLLGVREASLYRVDENGVVVRALHLRVRW